MGLFSKKKKNDASYGGGGLCDLSEMTDQDTKMFSLLTMMLVTVCQDQLSKKEAKEKEEMLHTIFEHFKERTLSEEELRFVQEYFCKFSENSFQGDLKPQFKSFMKKLNRVKVDQKAVDPSSVIVLSGFTEEEKEVYREVAYALADFMENSSDKRLQNDAEILRVSVDHFAEGRTVAYSIMSFINYSANVNQDSLGSHKSAFQSLIKKLRKSVEP